MKLYNSQIFFVKKSLIFNSNYYTINYLLHHQPFTIYNKSSKSKKKKYTKKIDIIKIFIYIFIHITKKKKNQTYII